MKKKIIPIDDHSKAIIVGLAYLIGFTTAYIAFELNDVKYKHAGNYSYVHTNKVIQQASAYGVTRAVVNEEGLFVVNDEGERIISAASSKTDLDFGFHRKIVANSMTKDQTMLHYCANMDDTEDCYHFVYVVSKDMVYPVRGSDGFIVTTDEEAKDALWLPNNTLQISDMSPVDPSTPWLMP